MGEHDNQRVEPRPILAGTGLGVTPERVAEIEHRRRELDRLSRPQPSVPFSEVMARRAVPSSPSRGGRRSPSTLKGEKRDALPQKGPRPSLVHPGQRSTFGRDVEDETVILKG